MAQYVVMGGGVAGVCCAEELCRICPNDKVVLVSASSVLKTVSVVSKITQTIEELQVEEKRLDELPYPNLRLIQDVAMGIDTRGKRLLLAAGAPLPYDKLCICAGARPKRLATDNPNVLTLRDTESIGALCARLPGARRVMVVGNGGIALELIDALRGLEIVWVLRHGHIGDAFFDLDAAQFLLEEMQTQRAREAAAGETGAPQGTGSAPSPVAARPAEKPSSHHHRDSNAAASEALQQIGTSVQAAQPSSQDSGQPGTLGHAAGPAWAAGLPSVYRTAHDAGVGGVVLEYGCEVDAITSASAAGLEDASWPVAATLSNGQRYGVDFVVTAIGVTPAVDWVPPEVERAPDGGLSVSRDMQTSVPGVYAAGDACSPGWAEEGSSHWFHMRLWSQARDTGMYTAHCMAGVADDMGSDMAFELFTHVTRFMGKKVVLLGLYNGQRLQHEPAEDMVTYSRVGDAEHGGGGCCRVHAPRAASDPSGRTFVRVLLLRGRMQGAVMIGETQLEEAFENLILDGLDVSRYGPALLDPDEGIDHVFD